MKKFPLIPILLIISFFSLTFQQCIYTYPLTLSSMDQCAGQYRIDDTQSNFPSQWRGSGSTKVFSFDLKIKLLGEFCSFPPSTFDFFSIQINPTGGLVNLVNFDWSESLSSGGSSVVTFAVNYRGTPFMTANGQYDISINTEFELLTNIDLTYAAPKLNGYLNYREAVVLGDQTITVGSDWKFDSSTKIYLCSSSSNVPSYYCSIQSFNYWFTNTNTNNYLYYTGQLTPTLLGSYLFGEGSGYRISDSESLGSAYFGNSGTSTFDKTNSPNWLSTEVGIEFTSSNQFVSVKPFQISKVSEYDWGSFTISFWIKYTRNVGNLGKIFQYTNYDMSHTYFSLQIENNGVLTASINAEADSFLDTSISSAYWTLVAVTSALHPTNTFHFLMFYIEGSSGYANFINAGPPAFAYNSLNKVHIGGPGSFKGSIYDFRIYSPGSSAVLTKGSCSAFSTNCLLSLGKLNSNQCLTKPAVTCHSSCKTCFDSTEQGCLSCYTDYHISYTQCISDHPVTTTTTLSPATTQAIKGSQKAAQAATQAVNAVTAGSPSGVSAAIGGKIFSNIKYLNITYSESLEEALTSWGSSFISLGLTPDLPTSITEQIPKEDLPYVFEKRDIPSSFIENFWESLGMVLFVTLIFTGAFILEWAAQKFPYKYLPHHLLFAIRAIIQNFLLAQLYSVFGDMLFFAALEFRAPNTHHKWSRLSLASGIILITIMFGILYYHIQLLRKYQNHRKNSDDQKLTKFENENKGSGVLFQDFKDVSIVRQSFLLLLTGRDLLFSLLLTVMFDHPLIECIFILVLNIAMVVYLILLPPFKSVFDATQQLFYEVVTLAVNVSVLVLAILDEISSPDGDNIRSKIGKFVIIINMVFNFGSLAFMLVKAIQTLYEVSKAYKARKNKQKTDLKIQAPDRFVKNLELPQQETNPKPYVEKINLIQFDLDQSTLKPLDVSNESFIINKEPSDTYQGTPKFETITYSFDQNNQFILKLDQTQEEVLEKKIPSTLEVSSIDAEENDDRTQALKAILEKNKAIRKALKFQTKLNEAALKVKNARQNSPKKK